MIAKEHILNELAKFVDIDYFVKAIISNPIKKGENLPKKLTLKKLC